MQLSYAAEVHVPLPVKVVLDALWGCLPKTTREETLAALVEMRTEWDREL